MALWMAGGSAAGYRDFRGLWFNIEGWEALWMAGGSAAGYRVFRGPGGSVEGWGALWRAEALQQTGGLCGAGGLSGSLDVLGTL
ncbi:unnamed protein product, partial [Staurois parvus]